MDINPTRDEVDKAIHDVALRSLDGKPGHTAVMSDEGTSYCLACELEGQGAKLRKELEERDGKG